MTYTTCMRGQQIYYPTSSDSKRLIGFFGYESVIGILLSEVPSMMSQTWYLNLSSDHKGLQGNSYIHTFS